MGRIFVVLILLLNKAFYTYTYQCKSWRLWYYLHSILKEIVPPIYHLRRKLCDFSRSYVCAGNGGFLFFRHNTSVSINLDLISYYHILETFVTIAFVQQHWTIYSCRTSTKIFETVRNFCTLRTFYTNHTVHI